jgi:hypothetical protein
VAQGRQAAKMFHICDLHSVFVAAPTRSMPFDTKVSFFMKNDDIDVESCAQYHHKTSQLHLDGMFDAELIPLKGHWEGHPITEIELLHEMLEVDAFPGPCPLLAGDFHFATQDKLFLRLLVTTSVQPGVLNDWCGACVDP